MRDFSVLFRGPEIKAKGHNHLLHQNAPRLQGVGAKEQVKQQDPTHPTPTPGYKCPRR